MDPSAKPQPVGGASSNAEDDWRAQALRFRAQRQTLLASNIANVDTPGYLARDMSFAAAMERSVVPPVPSPTLAATSPGHMAAAFTVQRSTAEFVEYVRPAQTNLDGNTVDLDRDRAEIAQNAILYQAVIKTLKEEFDDFKLASSDPRR